MKDKETIRAGAMLLAIILFGGWLTSATAHDPTTCPQAQVHKNFHW